MSTLLRADGVTMRFGGLTAVDGVDLTVGTGEIVGLIGPNGAGKTTFFNCMTGLYVPTEGEVRFRGELLPPRPARVTRAGIARTFQNIRLFAGMTVLENVLVGRHTRTREGLLSAIGRGPRHRRTERESRAVARELLDFVGLGRQAAVAARNLSYGGQRRLEIARALACEPGLLLLDEPTAGMNPQETRETEELVRAIRDAHPQRTAAAHRVVGLGLAHSPEGRHIFPRLTVEENLLLGAHLRKDTQGIADDVERAWTLFERLRERRTQAAGTLSGGEQQMLAMGRALMRRPTLLMLDEPSMGLSPIMMRKIMDTVAELRATGTTMLLVEQNARAALAPADRAYVMGTGRIVLAGTGAELTHDESVRKAYLGED
ncbi:ATP-binding cassette domain-containing protein [Streptomyces sp. NPDC005921]|uniref:ATP-binding cassette domain-containing protein n=1 Tax=Streptomyces sp. NPDC005827 TaxID=3157070 RepID=UPI0033C399D6